MLILLTIGALALLPHPSVAQSLGSASGASTPPAAVAPVAAPASPAALVAAPEPRDIALLDRPNDDGSALLLTFNLAASDGTRVSSDVEVDGVWQPCSLRPGLLATTPTKADLPRYFGFNPADPATRVLTVDSYMVTDDKGEAQLTPLQKGQPYAVRLVVYQGGQTFNFDADSSASREQWFNFAALNNLIFSVLFAIVIMAFIFAARKNPNLFIRRIQGLEAVDEAIGRATEMGKPVLHINGLDPLSTLSTVAAVNILGRIARRVANYDSTLLVPCFDPVVLTVSQEIVRNAYLEAGRPDAYREDHIFFLTDQQFSYTASTCGIMMREKPAAIFLLGMFYAESLMLAETGFSIGAIQIAGTDAQAQLPFFITTCDYTLIGEELYAASAYLSREPMLLGSLKGQDLGKAFAMLIIIVGTVLSTFGIEWLAQILTPLT